MAKRTKTEHMDSCTFDLIKNRDSESRGQEEADHTHDVHIVPL